MLDIALIRDDADGVQTIARDKNVDVDIAQLLQYDQERRRLQQELDQLEQQRNELARQVQGQPNPELIATGKALKVQASTVSEQLAEASAAYQHLLLQVPNLTSPDTPRGADESGNQVLRQHGTPPTLTFTPKPHWELGQALNLIDTERASVVTGSRFSYLKNELVWLQFALIQLAFSVVTNRDQLTTISATAGLAVPNTPFTPVIPPVMIKPDVFHRMARLEPRDERYHIQSDNLYLIGSAEHTLGPLHLDETIPEAAFPLRYIGYSTSFRREAGSHGKDVRGILRLHQFDKLEIESFTTPEQSVAEQDFIVAIQEHLMQLLGIPYQVVLKCTGDMGIPNWRALDIESWLPGQDQYRETHSADHMSDYQARRLRTKVKRAAGTSEYVHMNDATVFAIGRTLIAIMENYQQADGSIRVPDALHPYVPFTAIHAA